VASDTATTLTEATAIPDAGARRRRALARATTPYLLVAPAAVIFALFLAFPVGFAIWLSFHSWQGLTPIGDAQWIGLDNFRALVHDEVFREALINTAIFAIATTVLQLAVAFILAFTLWYYRLRFTGLLRAHFFFPAVLSMVVVGLTWRQVLADDGPLDQLLSLVGIGHIAWLSDPSLVIWVVAWVATWQWAGWSMLLLLAGMAGIPNEMVEAARVDGARSFAIARRIVLPMISHAVGLVVLLDVIGGFQVFDSIYVMTGGGPNHASEVLGTYSYWIAFSSGGTGELGYAATIAVVMIAVLFVFSYLRIRMTRLV
jgi:ABC-type sugar transport system permease subunit